tara:strand:- start:416 stop:1456 length:1041 start_codon:yes stop_codon:yes gene_type:complete
MRIQVDFSSHLTPTPDQSPVVQVEKTPVLGTEGMTVINGKFLLPMPLDLDFPVRGVHAGLITSVTDSGGVAVFVSLTHGLKEGDIVSITGTANYDGVWVVQTVPTDGTFTLGGVVFAIDEPGAFQRGDYLLNAAGNIDGNDLASQSMARLLAVYPMFGNIYFNPLLTDEHVNELDFTFDWVEPGTGDIFKPRFQTGREAPLDDSGQFPTHTALLAQNGATSPPRPGLIVTDEIDIGPYTLDCDQNPVGTDEFMVWWRLYAFNTTHDIASDFGAQAGKNEPALRYVAEMDQEPPDFSAYISIDGGANWCPVGLLEPVAFCEKTTKVMLAFRNTGSEKTYLASFALMF